MTRKVTVFEYWRPEGLKYNDPPKIREVGGATFLQFGVDCVEHDVGVGTFSTALVEMPDGHVKNVHVNLIRFDD